MIPVETYTAQLLADVSPLPVRTIEIEDALGCVLAQDVRAREAVPRFTNSAMDGFAVRAEDLGTCAGEDDEADTITLPVAGDIPAGDNAEHTCQPGTAWRIMTGARLPLGANTVVKVEDTTSCPGIVEMPSEVTIVRVPQPGANVRKAGKDCRVGDTVLRAGDVLTPAALSSAVSVGYGSVPVRPRVRVAVISTGDELVEAGQALDGAQIPDSNSVLLRGLLQRADAEVVRISRAKDNPEAFADAVMSVCGEVDLIITSGGISAGAYDVVKAAAGEIGLNFSQVAMQPGKPQGFGRVQAGSHMAWLCALSGNPVAVFVSFQVFVRPLLAALTGQSAHAYAPIVPASVSTGWRSPEGKRQFVPVRIDWSARQENRPVADPTHSLGARSHFVASLHQANGLAVVPESVTRVEAGDILDVIVV
ncbi:MAG: molybdopterin molybdotransferase MoeA [Actinomycetaceae bacterium]|nr:molybdopterin molybdotransferase MoeA [Actinomycetaceae bacterium]